MSFSYVCRPNLSNVEHKVEGQDSESDDGSRCRLSAINSRGICVLRHSPVMTLSMVSQSEERMMGRDLCSPYFAAKETKESLTFLGE